MNEIQVINQQNILGKDFKIYGTIDNPLFLAKDVAEWIEHSDVSMMIRNVDEDEKVTNIVCTPGGNQEAWFLKEDGLYEVFMQSRKPIAKAFKKKVKIILKDIRKHGMYAKDELLDNPDLMIQILNQLKEERQQKNQLQQKVEADKPKVLFAEALEISQNTILVGELAKLLKQNGVDIGQNRLFSILRGEGYLCKKKGELWNTPTQKAMDLKLFEIKKRTVSNPDGSTRTTTTTKVTGKGQQYFINKFLAEKMEVKN